MTSPEIFIDRINPITESTSKKVVEGSEGNGDDDDPINPDRVVSERYYLVHRDEKKLCPKKVSKCSSCSRSFTPADVVVVKTIGTRELMCIF